MADATTSSTAVGIGGGGATEVQAVETVTDDSLAELPWETTGLAPLYYNSRTVKMAKPVCEECQKQRRRDWYTDCKHDPYFQMRQGEEPVRVLRCSECDADLEPGANVCEIHKAAELEIVGEKLRRFSRRTLNIAEVPLALSNDSGQSVNVAISKGAKYPHELGFADMCQFARCYAPNPKLRRSWGDYCCSDHAGLVALNRTDEAIEVLDWARRAEQIRRAAGSGA